MKMVYFGKEGILSKYSSFSIRISDKMRQDIVSYLHGISSRDINDSVTKKLHDYFDQKIFFSRLEIMDQNAEFLACRGIILKTLWQRRC